MRPPDREKWHIVSITAHRKVSPADSRRIHVAMKHIMALTHIDAIYFGGARGGDTEALKGALHFRAKGPARPRLVVVVPNTLGRQPFETHEWTQQADEVIELKNPITPDDGFNAYTVRDQYLVDIATSLVAFWNGNYATGTGKTVRMAERDGLVVTRIAIQG